MEAVIYAADVIDCPANSSYQHEVLVKDIESAKVAFSRDYVCAKYQNNRRNIKNFVSSIILHFDIDNDGTDDESKWINPENAALFFDGAPLIVHYSRNRMKEKGSKKLRPKFHVIFLIKEIIDHKEYEGYK